MSLLQLNHFGEAHCTEMYRSEGILEGCPAAIDEFTNTPIWFSVVANVLAIH
jgi:hypothetical protein